jgi:hydrogenase maturation protease
VGNEFRGDDAAGLAIARAVDPGPGVTVREFDGEVIGLLDVWGDADNVVIVDAVRSGAVAGTVHRFDASAEPVPAAFSHSSSHTIGVGDAIELARGLGRLPRRVLIFGVEGVRFDAGAALSPEVAEVLDDVRDQVASAAATLAAASPPLGSP